MELATRSISYLIDSRRRRRLSVDAVVRWVLDLWLRDSPKQIFANPRNGCSAVQREAGYGIMGEEGDERNNRSLAPI